MSKVRFEKRRLSHILDPRGDLAINWLFQIGASEAGNGDESDVRLEVEAGAFEERR